MPREYNNFHNDKLKAIKWETIEHLLVFGHYNGLDNIDCVSMQMLNKRVKFTKTSQTTWILEVLDK